MEKLLTVFTPTYNRANLIHKCYESLKRQTVKDFEWLIIDDGSSDNTRKVVQNWIGVETEFKIRYIYKENGGLHTGYNTAIDNLKTELAMCIDSDDYLTDNCIELIKQKWDSANAEKYAGILGLDVFEDGKILGDRLSENVEEINLIDIITGYAKITKADRKIIMRTDLYKEVAPMIVFKGEKNFNPHYMHLEISGKYNMLVLNQALCVVEYQPDGMGANMWWQYYNSPNSFLEIRKQYLSFENISLKFKIKNTIHLISSCIFIRKSAIKECNNKLLCVILYPFGLVLNIITKRKALK